MVIAGCTSFAVFGMEDVEMVDSVTKSEGTDIANLESLFGLPAFESKQILQKISDVDLNTYREIEQAIGRLCQLRRINKTFKNYLTSEKIAAILKEQGLNSNATDENGDTTVISAVKKNMPEIVNVLIAAGANVRATTINSFWTPLHVVASYNVSMESLDIAKALIDAVPAKERAAYIATQDQFGRTVLYLSSSRKDTRLTKILLEAVQDPEQRARLILAKTTPVYGYSVSFGNTALHEASICDLTATVKMLLEALQDPEQRAKLVLSKNNDGQTALYAIADRPPKSVEIARMLIESLQDPEQKIAFITAEEHFGDTALKNAARDQNNIEFTKLLIRYYKQLGIEIPGTEKIDIPKQDLNSPDAHTVLGVRRGASAEEIRQAYIEGVRRFHPDKNPDDPEAKTNFQKLQAAYETLMFRK